MSFRSIPTRSLAPLLAAALCLGACAAGKMALPQNLSPEAQGMEVRKTYAFWVFGLRKIDFGPYHVHGYNSGWTDNDRFGVGGYASEKADHRFEFKLATGSKGEWHGRCSESASHKTVSKKGLGGGTVSTSFNRKASLHCAFVGEPGTTGWNLALSLQKGKSWTDGGMLGGELSDGARRYRVEGNNKMEGVRMGLDKPTGFSIKEDDKVLGAVQVINSPKVWMDPAAEAELGPPLALASAALMLQKNLLAQLEEDDP